MKFRVEVICVNDEGSEQRQDVMEMERQELAMGTLGLSLAEGKAILRGSKISSLLNKSVRISNADVVARIVAGGTLAKRRGRAPSRRCSGR